LYACNTGGAAIGALLASYAIIPALGVKSTTLLAALLNLLVALGALELGKSIIVNLAKPVANASNSLIISSGSRWVLFGAWFALAAGGVLSLGLEVIYVHMLSIVAGNSVYAFGLMLATFLTGLALGGEAGRRLIRRADTPVAVWLVMTQLALAVALILGTQAWDAIPEYFGSFADYPIVNGFRAHETIRGLVCAAVMIPPTILIGLSYTLAMHLATSCSNGRHMRLVGLSAALNTSGNILGVFLFGFVLLPKLGGLQASRVAALIALAIAVVVMVAATRRLWLGRLGAALVAAVVLLIGIPATLDYRALGSGASVYFAAQDWGDIIDHAESVDGGLTMVARRATEHGDVHTLLTNGKFQGNDATHGEVKAQIGFAAMSLLHQPSRGNALVIGYGTGMTSRVLHDAGFKHLDIAELSRDVIRLADGHFGHINERVSQLPGVTTHITDGRNMLLLSQQRYDIISIEITSIWFAGAASLYNQEFYKLAKVRMADDGVLQQWVQLHHMSQPDLLTIIGTLRAEFKYVSLYVVGGQGVLIATDDKTRAEVDPRSAAALDAAPGLEAIRIMAGRPFTGMATDRALSAQETDVLLDKVALGRSLWVSTDNNLRLEYSTPKANVQTPDLSESNNLRLLATARAAYAASQAKTAAQEVIR
jgi:predicted membrane-bound spermidine synthase